MLPGRMSCSAGAMSRVSDLDSLIALLSRAGYDTVDFWLFRYCNAPTEPMWQDNWREWVCETRAKLDAAGIAVGQVHAWWDHPDQVMEDGSFDLPGEIFRRNIEACRMLSSDKLVFHPIERWHRNTQPEHRQWVLDANVAWFSALLPCAEEFGVQLLIENLFDYKHVQQPGDQPFPCGTAEDVLYIINKINHPLMKACLDTGHANIAGSDVAGMVRLYGDKLAALHLQDNFGKIGPIYEDIHMNLTCGRIPWQEVFAALCDIGYQGTLNLEVNAELPRLPDELRLVHLKYGRELLRTIVRLYGKGANRE